MRIKSGGNVLIGTTTDSGAKLNLQGNLQVGVDDTGYDVTFYGATSGRYLQWDESDDSLLLKDNVTLKIGNGQDLRLSHNATDSTVTNYNGDLYITNQADDKDVILRCDDGSGGNAAYITLDGSQTTINLQQNVLIGTTSNSGGKLYVNSSTTDRVARFESSDSLAYLQVNDNLDSLYISTENQIGSFGGLTGSNSINFNISLTSGNAALGGTPNAAYKLDVVGKQRVQSVLELDDVLMLNQISTPADPAAGKSVIYMDSADGGIKCKINVGGTVVTRTLASFE
jgi:hypothetical protein